MDGVKIAKSNKTERTEELIERYQEAECVVSVVHRQKLTENGLKKAKQKV